MMMTPIGLTAAEFASLENGAEIRFGCAKLKIVGDQYVMEADGAAHSLLRSATPLARLNAHWINFASSGKARQPSKIERHNNIRHVDFIPAGLSRFNGQPFVNVHYLSGPIVCEYLPVTLIEDCTVFLVGKIMMHIAVPDQEISSFGHPAALFDPSYLEWYGQCRARATAAGEGASNTIGVWNGLLYGFGYSMIEYNGINRAERPSNRCSFFARHQELRRPMSKGQRKALTQGMRHCRVYAGDLWDSIP